MVGIKNPAHGAVRGGARTLSVCVGAIDNSGISNTAFKLQDAKSVLVRELLAESPAIEIDCAAKSLRHVLAADDEPVIGAFREFLLATQTATDCARELRDLTRAGQRPPILHTIDGGCAHG